MENTTKQKWRKTKIFLFLPFMLVGLNTEAQWQQTNGPYGGNITCLAVSGSNIFAGTESGGVFLSTNNGTSWTPVDSGLPNNFFVNSIAISGTNVFAGTNGSGGNGDIFLSTDNGTSWTSVDSGLPNTLVNSIAVSGTNIFAGTFGYGVFVSKDSGSSWLAVDNGLSNLYIISFAVNGTNIFAGTQDAGVFLSTNNGQSWTADTTGMGNVYVSSFAISGTNIFAGTGSGVFLSGNNGASWTVVVIGTNIFAGTISGLFLSANNGTSWTAINNGLTASNVQSLAISGSNIFAGTNGGGVFLSSNTGASWTAINNGLANTDVQSLAISGSNILAGTWGGGVFISSDTGASWTAVNNGLTNTYVLSLAISGSNIFAGTDGGGVFLSSNYGATWTAVNNDLTNTVVPSLIISGSNIFAGTYGGVFLSSDTGASWTAVNNDLTSTDVPSLIISGSNIFAGTFGGVFLSSDTGASWTAGLTNQAVYSLTINKSNIFAGTYGNGVFLSSDTGASWISFSSGLTNTIIWSLAISGTNIYAGSSGGGVWINYLPGVITPEINIDTNLPALYCAGAKFGVPFIVTDSFRPGNIFTAQLSDSAGSFTSPTNIGTLTSITSGSINATIPSNTTTGSEYRIRVVSSNPIITGTDNGTDITINALPAITVSSNSPVCARGLLNLSSISNLSDSNLSCTWIGPNGFTCFQQDTTISNETSVNSGIYTATVFDYLNGCSASASTFVTINELPAASSNSPVCAGSTLSLSSSGGTSYSWTGPNGFTCSQQDTTILNVTSVNAGTYNLTVGCGYNYYTSSTVVTLNPSPIPTPSSNSPVCTGDTLNLSSSWLTLGNTSYNWTGPNGYTSLQRNAIIAKVVVADSGNYTLTVTDTNGCSGSATIGITICPPLPIPYITLLNDTFYCSANPLYASYQWYSDTTLIPGATNNYYTTMQPGFYYINITSSCGCVAVGSIYSCIPPIPDSVITFQRTIGGPQDDYGTSIQQTCDGGYIIAGNTLFSTESIFGEDTVIYAGSNIYLVKTDNMGDTLWTKTFGDSIFNINNSFIGFGNDFSYIVKQSFYGYIIGANDPTAAFGPIYTNATGDLLTTIPDTITTVGDTIFPINIKGFAISDNGTDYLEVGNIRDYDTVSHVNVYYTHIALIIKSNTVLESDFEYNKKNDANCVQYSNDGGYIIVGTKYDSSGNGHIYLLKISSDDSLRWSKIYGDSTVNEQGIYVQQTEDSGYIILATDYYPGNDSSQILLIKTNSIGDTIWSKTYGENANGSCIQQTSDGGYIVVGSTWNLMDSSDVYFFKMDSSGNILWSKTYGGSRNDYGSSVQQTNDGGYIIVGSTNSFGSGGSDIFMIKTDSSGYSGCNETNPHIHESLVPHPASNPSTSTGSHSLTPTLINTPVFFLSWTDSTKDSLICSLGFEESVKESTYSNSILIYPNPSNENFNLQLTDNKFENAKLNIYNSIGQNIYSSEIENSSGGITKQIYLNVTAGIYLIRVSDGEKQEIKKLIIQ